MAVGGTYKMELPILAPKFESKHPKYSMGWNKDVDNFNNNLGNEVAKQLERRPNESAIQALDRLSREIEKHKINPFK
jgi:hypothetical protein